MSDAMPDETLLLADWLERQRRAGMIEANWNGFCRAGNDTVMISLRGDDGRVHRFRLPAEGARQFAEGLLAEIDGQRLCSAQSDRSSGMESRDGSTPHDGKNVCPPTRSSSAVSGDT